MKKSLFLFFLLFTMCFFVFSQTPVNIDIPALIGTGGLIFLAGIAGLPVMAIIALIKRWVNATGPWVRIISFLVSSGCVTAYLISTNWNWLHFIILTIIVTLSANGIYLGSQKRNP